MRIPKRYGQSRVENCPFCQKQATTESKQKVPVCTHHKEAVLNEMKCLCGEPLDLKSGKYGVYFTCITCGNINGKKVFEINKVEDVSRKTSGKKKQSTQPLKKKRIYFPRVETITSDDPRYFD